MSFYNANFPLNTFLVIWLLVVSLRTIGFLDYESVEWFTFSIILVYVVLFIIGFYLGQKYRFTLGSGKVRLKPLLSDPIRGLNLLIAISVILGFICIGSMLMKMKSMSGMYGIDLSLKGISDLRKSNLSDASYELGSNVYGMIASMLFGFPVLCGVVAEAHKRTITSPQKKMLWATFVMGLLASFLSGGRFMAFTFALFYYFSNKMSPVGGSQKRRSFSKNLIVAAMSVLLIWVFSQMFLDRLGVGKISFAIYYLPLCTPKDFTTYLLTTIPGLDTIIALAAYFEYYVAHGVNQLDVLLNAPYPAHAPYWGGYELSTFFLFFSKIGFPVITSDVIVSEIVNPGVYFTHIGALILDFGWGFSALVVLMFSYLVSRAWTQFHRHPSELSLFYLNVILLSLLTFAPIVSLVSTGYFAAVLVSFLFIKIFESFVVLPTLKADRQLDT